jgi:hypothetical protein
MRAGIFGTLAIGAVAALVVLGASRAAFTGAAPSPSTMIPFLIAVGALCVAGLTIRRQPTVAWLAMIVCIATVTIDLAALGREQRFLVSDETWQWLAIAIALCAILATSASAAYAADPAHRVARWVPPVAAAAVILVFGISAWTLATPDPISVPDHDGRAHDGDRPRRAATRRAPSHEAARGRGCPQARRRRVDPLCGGLVSALHR